MWHCWQRAHRGQYAACSASHFQIKACHAHPPRPCQCHSRLVDGCRSEGQFGPSGRAHGDGGYRRSAVARRPQVQSRQSGLVGSRPFRAVERPRLDAPVFGAAPDGLSPVDGRDQEFSAVRLEDGRPSGARGASRDRNHYRAPGPRFCQRRRHGIGRAHPRRHIQSSRPRHHRSSYLCVPRRRLHDGRDFPRGRFICRGAEARQAHCGVRQQRYFHRRQGGRLVRRQHGGALRGLWLACAAARRRSKQRRRRSRLRRGTRRNRAPVADLRADGDRLGGPQQAGHRIHARRSHGQRGNRRDAPQFGMDCAALRNTGGHSGGLGHARQGCARRSGVARPLHGIQERIPRVEHRAHAAHAGRAAERLCRTPECLHRPDAGRGQGARHAPGVAGGLECDRSLHA